MTVGELIEQLKRVDPDLPVVREDDSGDHANIYCVGAFEIKEWGEIRKVVVIA